MGFFVIFYKSDTINKMKQRISSPSEPEVLPKRKRLRFVPSRKRIIRTQEWMFVLILFIGIFSYLTNPFTKYSIVLDPFPFLITQPHNLSSSLSPRLYVMDNMFSGMLGHVKNGWHLAANRFSVINKQTAGTTVEEIIDNIHALRFNPKEPYLISGDHFSVLYPRSLGIFYHSAMDPRTARSPVDWENRQEIYLKTLAYALETFSHTKRLSTTIVPVGPASVTLVNYFAPPSDTLYSLFYALNVTQSTDELFLNYSYSRETGMSLATQQLSQQLLEQYKKSLVNHYTTYQQYFDPVTRLPLPQTVLSGSKDAVVRRQGFYDAVMYWKTEQLAQKLGLVPENKELLNSHKETIIETFWNEKDGYFYEDLSQRSGTRYSSDWLISTMTGFLDYNKEEDRTKIERSVAFIRTHNLDRPFGLMYEMPGQERYLVPIVAIFTKDYGTENIWSYLGMEYIKTLSSLYRTTCNDAYLTEAMFQLDQYKHNIESSRGYPEVYDRNGKPYKTVFYESIHQTGWIVSFEQAKHMVEYTKENSMTMCPKV